MNLAHKHFLIIYQEDIGIEYKQKQRHLKNGKCTSPMGGSGYAKHLSGAPCMADAFCGVLRNHSFLRP
jgi:hypothetical protein